MRKSCGQVGVLDKNLNWEYDVMKVGNTVNIVGIVDVTSRKTATPYLPPAWASQRK